MSTIVDSYSNSEHAAYTRVPHRKPVAPGGSGGHPVPHLAPNQAYQASLHSRTRTSSSSIFPPATASPNPNYPAYASQAAYQAAPNSGNMYQPGTARRTLSNATASTTSTSASNTSANANTNVPGRVNSGVRRSSSICSGGSPTSYVALMRKQKGTVWCERAQQEDPRLLAQQRLAKQRATIEMVGGASNNSDSNRTSTSSSGGVAAGVRKIRHHGAVKFRSYAPGRVAGSGVPTRLLSTEPDEDDDVEDGDAFYAGGSGYHHRTGSGRSSLGSNQRLSTYLGAQGGHGGRLSTGSTPPNGSGGNGGSPLEQVVGSVSEETPVADSYALNQKEYFQSSGTGLSGGSGSSGERENSFGNLGVMPQNQKKTAEDKDMHKSSDELRRRGSVDDRTMTMSGVRLFVANPDLSD